MIKKFDNKDLIRFYSEGLNDVEISKKLDCTSSCVAQNRIKLGLKSNFKYKSRVSYNEFMKLYDKGMNDTQISKIVDLSQKGVQYLRRKLSLPSNNLTKEVELTEFQKSVFIGTILGDGSISLEKDSKNARCSFGHSIKQKEYCEHKRQIFSNIAGNIRTYTYAPDKRTGNVYVHVSFNLQANPYFNYYHNIFYKESKIIPKEIFKDFNEISLAFLFMDDGCKHKNGYYIALNSFKLEDIFNFKLFLEKRFDIECSIHSKTSLYIKKKSIIKFTTLIKPYIIPSMEYKLHVLNKSGELLENPEVDNQQPS